MDHSLSDYLFIGEDSIFIKATRVARRYLVIGIISIALVAGLFISGWSEMEPSLKLCLIIALPLIIYFEMVRNVWQNRDKSIDLQQNRMVLYRKMEFQVDHIYVFRRSSGKDYAAIYGVKLVASIQGKRYDPVMIVMVSQQEAKLIATSLAELIGVEVLTAKDFT